MFYVSVVVLCCRCCALKAFGIGNEKNLEKNHKITPTSGNNVYTKVTHHYAEIG